MATPRDVIEEELTCAICTELCTIPKSLPCMHTFCQECLEKYVKVKETDDQWNPAEVPCPTCREKTDLSQGIASIRTNFIFVKMIEAVFKESDKEEPKYCGKCIDSSDESIATAYCKECTSLLCDLCVTYHKRSRDYTNHSVVLLDSTKPITIVPSSPRSPDISDGPKCNLHQKERLCLFCTSCDLVLCTCCAVLHHRDCSYEYIDDTLIQRQQEVIKKELNSLQELQQKVTNHHKMLLDTKTNLDDSHQGLLSQIESSASIAEQEIHDNKKEVITQVGVVYNQKVAILKSELDHITSVIDQLATALKLEATIESTPGMLLLQNKKEILDKIQSHRNQFKDLELRIPEGVDDVQSDIHFQESTRKLSEKNITYVCDDLSNPVKQGKKQSLVVHSKNKDGNSITHGGAECTPQISHTHDPTSLLSTTVDDNGDGSYTIHYTPYYHTPLKLTFQNTHTEPSLINVVRNYTSLVPLPEQYPLTSSPCGVCPLPGNRIAVTTYEKKVEIFDRKSKEKLAEITSNFVRPYLMTVQNNSLWVTDREAHNIQKFSLTREGYPKLLQYGTKGGHLGQFLHPRGIAFHPTSGYLYIADMNNHRIQVFKPTPSSLDPLRSFGREGKGEGDLDKPAGILFNREGHLVVCDDRNCRLQVFSPEGRYITSFGISESQKGVLCSPIGIAQDYHGRYIVGEFGSHLVTVLSPEGNLLSCVRSVGGDIGPFTHPRGVSIDDDGFIYVADFGNQRIVCM